MKATFDGTYVTAPAEAKTFYEQSGYGRIEKNGKLRLAPVEALYLTARGKLEIEGFNFDTFLSACADDSGFLRNYIVYRDIRERGYVITTGPHDYRVFPRGQRPGHGQSKYLIRVFSEREIVDFSVVVSEAETAANMRKQFVLAVADDENELTYYEIRIQNLQAKTDEKPEYPKNIQANFAGSSVYVPEDDAGSIEKLSKLWFGTMLGDKRLFLASVEAAWLLEQGLLVCEPQIQSDEYLKVAKTSDFEFSDKMVVYRYLRGIGFSPRTGYKYGHHFRVYTEDGKHSEMLIHTYSYETRQPMSVISRSVRLAHSVKKKMLFAVIKDDSVTFIEFARMKL